ncbi:MAG TPA: fused MFS/spermidine synthase [Steroidobacteraceae bacterium]|nr:fused MFS/spermidine synthase [Steroidobacteraceae bacterium]
MSAHARIVSKAGHRVDQGPAPGVGRWALSAITACFLLSGFAALIYQTAWLRQFSLVFGTAEFALAAVVAAYMAGLAAGAALIRPRLDRIVQPLRWYAVIEFSVAITALAVPLMVAGLGWTFIRGFGHQPGPPGAQSFGQLLFTMAGAFAVLLLPTALMGATLPLLTRHAVERDEQVGRRTALLYAFNTLGAAAGALAAGFLLLPRLGLERTVWFGATCNLAAAAIAALLARQPGRHLPAHADKEADHSRRGNNEPSGRPIFAPGPHWILPIMLLSGGVSFVYEVLWTRMLSLVLGSSLFAFATMLASVLIGIAAGSAVAGRIALNRVVAARIFVIAQLLAAAAAAIVYQMLDRWLPASGGLGHHPWLAIFLLLPATFAIGATYPLAVRVLADDAASAATAAARTYAWNTIGCVFGALLAGLWILPRLRFEGAAQFAVAGNLLLALLTAVAVLRAQLPWLIALGATVAASALVWQPHPPVRLLRESPLGTSSAGQLRYYDVGRSATVVVFEREGLFALRNNGLPEASIESAAAPPRFAGEYWLSPIASIAMPRASSLLLVGLGGGSVIEGAAPRVRSIDVVELEPRVVEANRVLSGSRKHDPLLDPRIRLVLNDARAALMLTDMRYDAIVSQPSHPWTSGASHLYTREFLRLTRAHLNDSGVLVQWMNIAYLDEPLLRSFAATLLEVFPELEIYRPDPYTLIFVASAAPLGTVERLGRTSAPIRESSDHFGRVGILASEDLAATLVADHASSRELAKGAPIITDDRNRLATSGVYELGRGMTPASAGRLLALYDPIARPDGWAHAAQSRSLSLSYIARRLSRFAAIDPALADRIDALARSATDGSTALLVRAMASRARGDEAQARQLLAESLDANAENRQALFETVRPDLAAILNGAADATRMKLAARLTGSAAAVIDAQRYAGQGDWQKASSLDSTLALANPTDAWYVDALVQRAAWRGHVSSPELRAEVGSQCLALIDRALVAEPTVAMFELRARCAAVLGRPDAVLESIDAFASGTLAGLDSATSLELDRLAARFEALTQAVSAAGSAPGVDVDRAREVDLRLRVVADEIRRRRAPTP